MAAFKRSSKPDQPHVDALRDLAHAHRLFWLPEPPDYDVPGQIWSDEAQTGVALAAIRRSRRAWLEGRPLTAFSSTVAARQAAIPAGTAYELTELGTATVIVGPLVFADTKLWEAKFAAPKPGQLVQAPAPPPTPAPTPPAPTAPGGPPSSALIAELGNRARTDPQLATVLKAAAEGRATPAELQQLSRFINSLQAELDAAKPAPVPVKAAAAAPRPAQPAKQRTPTLVFEFAENPADRYCLPAVFSVAASASSALVSFNASRASTAGPSMSRSGQTFGSFNGGDGGESPALVVMRLESFSATETTLPALDRLARACDQAKVTAMFTRPTESLQRYLVYRSRDLQAEVRRARRLGRADSVGAGQGDRGRQGAARAGAEERVRWADS